MTKPIRWHFYAQHTQGVWYRIFSGHYTDAQMASDVVQRLLTGFVITDVGPDRIELVYDKQTRVGPFLWCRGKP